jgi:hypothetical protein
MKGPARTMLLWLGMFATPATCAYAQGSAPDPPPEGTAREASATVDPTKLGVSLERIRNQLAVKPATKTSGLKIQETIEVVGVAPKIQLWNPETAKLATGPVPWGAPTHRDFIDLVTPKEFKNYPMDLNALMQWLMQHLGDKTAKDENKTTE